MRAATGRIPYAEALEGHNIFAVDIMGDVGHSKPDIGYSNADAKP